MKKKILGGIAAIAIATVVALNMQITVGENECPFLCFSIHYPSTSL